MRETRGQRVRLEMVYRNEGQIARDCDGLAGGDTDDETADQAWARRRANPVYRLPVDASRGQTFGDEEIEELYMGTRGNLRHHAAELGMERELGADQIGQDGAFTTRVAAHQGGGGFIAARFDAEDGELALV